MAKAKTAEEYKTQMDAAKEDRKAAREEFKAFCKEKKLKTDTAPTDEKLLKKWNKLNDQVNKKVKAVTDLEESKASVKKPAKDRVFKYDYPAGLDSDGKKKFRAAARAQANRDAKAAAGGGKKKKSKDGKKGKSAPVVDIKSAGKKKSKKAKPTPKAETAVAETGTED